jgi:aminopeptidase N
MIRRIGFAFVLVSVACGGAGAGAAVTGDDAELRFRAMPVDESLPEVDASGYEIELTEGGDVGHETFAANVKGSYTATADLRELTLDFDGNEIDEVTVSGRHADYTRVGATLHIRLPDAVKKGSTFSTRVAYHGTVRQADGEDPDDFANFGGFMVKQRNTDGARIFTSLSWPYKARRWLPLRDHPRDVAQVAITATFASSFTVLANGKHLATTENANGTRTWHYEALTPMPTYDFHVSAYESWDIDNSISKSNIPVATYTYKSGHALQKQVFGDLTKALDFYEDSFGAYRWGSASFIEEPIFGGGMEHASVVSMDETLFDADDVAEARKTAFHELAHHWSGNLVHFRRWNDFWLSEGFTEYLTGRAVTHIDGPEAGKQVWRDYLDAVVAQDEIDPHPLAPAGDEIDVLTIFDDIPYEKGALTVRMLEHIVGEATMAKFLRDWFDRHAFNNAVDTDDFERELEAASGQDLKGFFDTMVRGRGHPELKTTFAPSGDGVDVTIEQTQKVGPRGGFLMPIDLDLVCENGTTERVRMDLSHLKTTAHFKPKSPVKSVVTDPDEVAIAVIIGDTRER